MVKKWKEKRNIMDRDRNNDNKCNTSGASKPPIRRSKHLSQSTITAADEQSGSESKRLLFPNIFNWCDD